MNVYTGGTYNYYNYNIHIFFIYIYLYIYLYIYIFIYYIHTYMYVYTTVVNIIKKHVPGTDRFVVGGIYNKITRWFLFLLLHVCIIVVRSTTVVLYKIKKM